MSDVTTQNDHCPHGESDRTRGVAALLQGLSEARARALHPLAPVLAHLCLRVRRHDAADPDWTDADRLLACGPDGVAALGAIARLLDPEAAAEPDLRDGIPRGGQGIAMAAGMAVAERAMAARFGRSLADHRTWALTNGEELGTGLALEAAHVVVEMGLAKLTLIAEAPADCSVARGYAALGFAVRRAEAGDSAAVAQAFTLAARSRKPTLLLFSPAGPDVPAARDVHEGATVWAQAAARGAAARRAWRKRLTAHAQRASFERACSPRGADCDGGEADPAEALRRLAASPDVMVVLSAQARKTVGQGAGLSVRGPASVSVANGIAGHGGFSVVSVCLPHEAEAALPALRYAAAHGLLVSHVVLDDAGQALAGVLATVPGLSVDRCEPAGLGSCVTRTMRRASGPAVIL